MSFKEKINKVFGIHSPSKAIIGLDLAKGKLDGLRSDMQFIDEFSGKTYTKMTLTPESIIEEWIWVEGYKGTYSDMTCNGYQYELGKQYDIEKGTVVKECSNGFHLCLKLEDVFNYYGIGGRNRFFKVKALVRKSEYDTYGQYEPGAGGFRFGGIRNKLAATSIIFTEEASMEELCEAARKHWRDIPKDMPDKYIQMAFESDVHEASRAYIKDTLIEDGYSVVFTNFIVEDMPDKFEVAHAVASLEDLSMDVKVMTIMTYPSRKMSR